MTSNEFKLGLSVVAFTALTMLGGKLLDADALRTAAGFSGRPK